MKVIIGSDHRGFNIKKLVKKTLKAKKIEYEDIGVSSTKSVDYPDIAFQLTEHVTKGEFERGILICNTGIGMSISANKIKGIYAALCLTPDMAEWARKHNNANIMTLSGAYTNPDELENMLTIFLETEFEGKRHEKRLNKIIEKENELIPKNEIEKLEKKLKKWEKEAHHWKSRAWRR